MFSVCGKKRYIHLCAGVWSDAKALCGRNVHSDLVSFFGVTAARAGHMVNILCLFVLKRGGIEFCTACILHIAKLKLQPCFLDRFILPDPFGSFQGDIVGGIIIVAKQTQLLLEHGLLFTAHQKRRAAKRTHAKHQRQHKREQAPFVVQPVFE